MRRRGTLRANQQATLYANVAGYVTKVAVDNLAAVMRLAGAKNLDIQIAQQRFVEAQAAHEQAVMQFFPYVSPGVAFKRHEGNAQTVDGQIIDTNKESFGAGVNVTAQLELGETIYKAMIAKRLATDAQFAADVQRQESVYQGVADFFELVRAKAARGVAVESVRIADSYAGELGRAVEAGIAFKGDAFRALAQAERNRLVLANLNRRRCATKSPARSSKRTRVRIRWRTRSSFSTKL